jgi:AraC-like DNA-binding protein
MAKLVNKSAQAWVSTRHLQHIVIHGEAIGLRMDELLSAGGLDKSRLADPDGAVPVAAFDTMLDAVADRYHDPLMGLHLAGVIQPATFGAVGYLMQACTSFADVLKVATRYNGLLSNIGTTSLQHRPGFVHVCWQCTAGSDALRRQATEYVIGAFVVMARLLLPEKPDLVRAVHFAHARPACAAQVREYVDFFRCPVHFEQESTCFVVANDALREKLHHGDAFLKDILDRHARELLQRRRTTTSLADEVRHLIRSMIAGGAPSMAAVAAQLGMSHRSLHRRLSDGGCSYRDLLEEIRLELAHRYLQATQEPVSHAAARLGFHSHQAFMRWFKQRSGQTPGRFRSECIARDAAARAH